MRSVLFVALGLSAACTPDFTAGKNASDGSVGGTDTGDVGGEDEVDPAIYDGATLRIVAPLDGAFLALEDAHEFEAELLDADGDPLDYTEITWTSSLDDSWVLEGAVATVEPPVGRHTFRATAILPNGDQVTDAVGGVLVQSDDAGVYAGNMILDATGEYEGTPITASCVGGAVLVVDAYGETATGESTCLLSLLGFNQELTHVFDFDLSSGEIEGSATVDLGFFAQEFDAAGDLDGGSMTADWADNLYGFVELEGTLEVDRITRDLSGE